MRIYGVRLPDNQRFPCSRKAVKDLIGEDLRSVSFWSRSFHFDYRHYSHRPAISGKVVASMTFDPVWGASLYLYAVPRAEYPDSAVSEFSASVMPQFRDWLTLMLARPETEVFGSHEEMIAEWVKGEHRLHLARSLYRST